MTIKRERLQVIYDILNVVKDKNGKIKPTHIMYKANLSHQMLEEYLKDLISKEFILESKHTKGKTYSLTNKGFDYLKEFTSITNFMVSFGLN